MTNKYKTVGSGFKSTADIPKDDDLFYRCLDCGGIIPSVPNNNIGCDCGNIFIDKDYWRLIVVNLEKLEVLKKMARC